MPRMFRAGARRAAVGGLAAIATLLAATLLAATLLAAKVAIAADIAVAPTYIQLDRQTRAAAITVTNLSDRVLKYAGEWTFYSYDDAGRATAEPALAEPVAAVVRFAPREFTLQPRGVQRVRLLLRPRSGTDAGEYRGHIRFAPVEAVQPVPGPEGQASISISYQYAVSVPVVAHIGRGEVAVSFSRARLDRSGPEPAFEVTLEREGAWTFRGTVEVVAGQQVIAQTRNVAIYGDMPRRHLRMQPRADTALPAGPYRVVARSPASGAVLAETVVEQ